MFARDGLFGILFGDLIRLRTDKSNEFDAAVDEEVARFFREGNARVAG